MNHKRHRNNTPSDKGNFETIISKSFFFTVCTVDENISYNQHKHLLQWKQLYFYYIGEDYQRGFDIL